ncbi:MAG: sulfatase-like hydrolase/transferase [Lentisphaerales bacterium]|nr:sulfatase-like hydrolase/transferase [Lentisphaerales bacterium]
MKLKLTLLLLLFQQILTAADKPNIIFIFADDWGWGDLSCHGHPYIKTPNIDRLAKEGTDFYRFTVASGVCSPSRAAVMTGHFPARYSIDGHFAWVPSNAKRGMPDWLDTEAPMMQKFLQQAGYRTAHYGKWHLANNMIPDSPLPSEYGYDEYGAFNCAGEQMPYHEDSMHTVKFIEKSHKEGKPFFVNLWIHEPHTPFHTQPKYEWRFRDLPRKDNIYASVLSHADDRIGEVLDALDRLKIADNTLVIFSSDNGPARNPKGGDLKLQYDTASGAGWGVNAAMGITGGRKGFKASLMEGGIGVPFLVRWPEKVAAGKVNDVSPISAVDLLPTFCEIAGIKLPSNYIPDGISQVKALKGEDKSTDRTKPLFWKIAAPWPAYKDKPEHWASYVIAYKNWKLLSSKKGEYYELYDIVADPFEKNDLMATKKDVSKELIGMLDAWKKSLPDGPSGKVFSKERRLK